MMRVPSRPSYAVCPLLVALAAIPAWPRPLAPVFDSPWLHVDPVASELRVTPGAVVEFRGSGRLVFREGRRVVGFPGDVTVTVDGRAVTAQSQVEADVEVLLVSRDGRARWHIHRVPGLPQGGGTRITDDGLTGSASVSSREMLRFYLSIGTGGGSTFVLVS